MKTTIYSIKNKDTLTKIAQKFNTTHEKIAKENNIKDHNLIIEDQTLKITHQDYCDLSIVFCDKAALPISTTCKIQTSQGHFTESTKNGGLVEFKAIGNLDESVKVSIKGTQGDFYQVGEIILDSYSTKILAKSRSYQIKGTTQQHKGTPQIEYQPPKNKKLRNEDINKQTELKKSQRRDENGHPQEKLQIKNIESARVRAFLKMIRVGEGTSDTNGYRRLVGGGNFDNFNDHPLRVPRTIHMKGKAIRTTAAGAYQILYRTWVQTKKQLDLNDFSPDSQDKAAIRLIKNRKAIEDVKKGNIKEAIIKCNKEWASLPESPYGQPARTMKQALETYNYYYTQEIAQ